MTTSAPREQKHETRWYKDAAFVKEPDEQYKAWKDGSVKGYTMQQVDETITALRKKRS